MSLPSVLRNFRSGRPLVAGEDGGGEHCEAHDQKFEELHGVVDDAFLFASVIKCGSCGRLEYRWRQSEGYVCVRGVLYSLYVASVEARPRVTSESTMGQEPLGGHCWYGMIQNFW
jgi:hypothetical protein